jgi:phosphoglycerol transferase MdoB-like AlkP superfamily enzyme
MGAIFASAVAIRGGVMYRPIAVGDAFFSNQVTQGYLVLNGPFSITRAFASPSLNPVQLMSDESATQRVRSLLGQSSAEDISPLEFDSPALVSKQVQPNVVILLLESWGALQVDAMREQMQLPKLGATPNFDKLAQGGRLFTNFYATGQRSIVGLSTLMTGLPVLPGMPAMGDGMEQFSINFIGDVAKSKGYQTLFMQSSDRLSLRLNAISGRAGFDSYLGAEDMPELHDAKKPSGVWGTWDHNTLQEANKQFASMKRPFFGFVFTSTTHSPWFTPGHQWDKFPVETDAGKALNSMYYADWALGEFIAAAKKSGYYDNTIFILLADHSSQFIEHREDARNLFRIPLLMVGPGVNPGIDARLASQPDLLPTLVDITAWQGRYKSVGKSLFRKDQGHAVALGISDRVMTLITPNGWLSHDLTQRLGRSDMSDAQAAEMELDLFALYQSTANAQLDGLVKTNKPNSTR